MSDKTEDKAVETTGHSWDGIEEYNNPLPRWWLWTFYATILWAMIYTILYPAWPLIHGATAGLLGYSTRAAVAEEIAAVDTKNAGEMQQLAGVSLDELVKPSPLHDFAVKAGAAVFRSDCSQCHGAGAAGVQSLGYPNLLDDDWLWGGTMADIAFTVTNGIRNEQSPDARIGDMPAFGEVLSRDEIVQAANYVRQISGQSHDAALASAGAQVFADNCAACHGDDGKGTRDVGAPNLTDAIWLYGGSVAVLTTTITGGRGGVMPAWSEKFRGASGLNRAEINAVTAYVHQLGGGE